MKDYGITLNTGVNGVATFEQKVKGQLKALVINSDEKVAIKITSELKYVIFDDKLFYGDKYISLGVQILDNQAHGSTSQMNCYCLNEKVQIVVNGPKNIDVNIIMRFDTLTRLDSI